MNSFSTDTARTHINDAADCMQDAKRTIQKIVRRFPKDAAVFNPTLARLEQLRVELATLANEFEPDRTVLGAGLTGSHQEQASCRLSA